jgi:plasmid stabilization system protein ParE
VPIRLRPQVEDEVTEAMAWYQGRRSGLELDFYRTFLEVLDVIAESPDLYRTVYGDVRRVVFRRFPYVLFYIFTDDEVVVLACMHERRSPDRWPLRADT